MTRILLTVLLMAPAQSQERFDPNALFQQAREMEFAGKREDSKRLCLKILEQYPDYSDVRVFLGRLQAWDAEYDAARVTLLDALSHSPG